MADYFCILQSVGKLAPTIMIGIITGYIAWQQLKTNKENAQQQHKTTLEKLRLDLYQRRFVVYENTLAYYLANTGQLEYNSTIENNFIKTFRESLFLFDVDDGITSLLDDIRKNGSVIQNRPEVPKGNAEEIIRIMNEHSEAQINMYELVLELEAKLADAKYLGYHKARV